ncbi:exodeoxyribonuclease VII large subunit [Thiomicrospira pelophila]|uniref:exodeoxyribonuclease VII large subunit n=1 Tax=Thiomicrospira pelophila TaxID=934 RepID=UPI0004A75D96|nr:exodeoxyribonuclease VII large subunit [Thiomicrospira pelophila]
MLYLDVPYPDKDLAKQQGAGWDPLKRKWYLPDPDQVDLSLFSQWLDSSNQSDLSGQNAIVDSQTASLDLSFDSVTLSSEEETEANSVSLSQLLNQVQTKLKGAFPKALWVRAEIANINERRGHIYLELSENNDQGQTLASCRAMIWASNASRLLSRFEQVTGSALQDGQKVLIQVGINFHEKFGFSLVVEDLDPKFTLGEIEANLIAIRKELIKQGIYQSNKQIPFPADLFRIAVISPPNAAGLGDFRAEADALEYYNLCEFVYFHSSFQGEAAVSEMLSALDAFSGIHQKNPFDALVIIRGGGAKLDLNPLNQLELAKAITTQPLPVLTGIGHERDNTILDEVACLRFDTPSKVVAGIWHRIENSAKQATQNWQQIERLSQQQLQTTQAQLQQLKQQIDYSQNRNLTHWKTQLEPLYTQIKHTSQQWVSSERASLDYQLRHIISQAQQPISRSKQQIESNQQLIEQNAKRAISFFRQQLKQTMGFILSSGPQSQLKRGFAMAKTQQGAPISSAAQAQSLSQFRVEFQDGSVQVQPLKS